MTDQTVSTDPPLPAPALDLTTITLADPCSTCGSLLRPCLCDDAGKARQLLAQQAAQQTPILEAMPAAEPKTESKTETTARPLDDWYDVLVADSAQPLRHRSRELDTALQLAKQESRRRHELADVSRNGVLLARFRDGRRITVPALTRVEDPTAALDALFALHAQTIDVSRLSPATQRALAALLPAPTSTPATLTTPTPATPAQKGGALSRTEIAPDASPDA